MTDSKNTIIF